MKLGIGIPSMTFIINVIIAIAIFSLAAKYVLPENIKQYFRV